MNKVVQFQLAFAQPKLDFEGLVVVYLGNEVILTL